MKPEPLSQRAYARHRGCSVTTVCEAIARGRLKNSLTADGKIRDAAEADAEWAATTHADRQPLTGPGGKMPDDHPRRRGKNSDLGDSMARKAAADAGLAEIKLAQARGELVRVADAEEQMVSAFTACKTKLLGVHSRARQRDPALTKEQVDLFESLIREALEDLSGPEAEVQP